MGRSWSRADALDQVPVFTRLSAVWPALNSTSEAKCVASGPDGNPRTSRITENQNSDRRAASRDPFARWILRTQTKSRFTRATAYERPAVIRRQINLLQ